MRVDATIQVRMGSTRLPGKTLMPILGKPMLALQIERIRQSRLIDRIILATTDLPQDDVLESLAKEMGVLCFRGSENDVLGRVVGAIKRYDIDVHVEFQGDNPMPDALLVDSIVGFYLKNSDRFDYVTNALKTTYPPGFEVSVYPAKVLLEAEKLATDPKLREHVGIHIYQKPDHFRIHNIEALPYHCEPDLHVEVDTPEDFKVVSAIYEHFYPKNPGFGISQVIQYAQEQGLMKINSSVQRRWSAFRES